ncbi:MAG: arginine--tRNA ligase [Candidatus Levyibacteriota bacterium]
MKTQSLKRQLRNQLENVLHSLGTTDVITQIDYPTDPKHGDFSSNVSLVGAKKLQKTPRDLAEEIAKELRIENGKKGIIEKVEIAGPGFLNFWMKEDYLIEQVESLVSGKSKIDTDFSGKKVMVEFAHPNTHKAFHIGHLRNITTGESLIRLLEAVGAHVTRVNYQGDVGMHIAKCLYGILQSEKSKVQSEKLDIKQKVALLGEAYAAGSKAYEEDENAKKEIGEINKKIYGRDRSIWELYQTTRQWSLDYFAEIYKRVYTHYDRYYFESEVYETGKENVLRGLKDQIFQKSDGAILFPGEKFRLHNRVFITHEGNPTYEGKEMGLGPLQFEEYHPDLIIHVVGHEQAGYFQVVFEALAQLFPETRGKEFHLAYGLVKLKHGKMSSRSGNVILGEWLIDEAKKRIFDILKKNKSDYSPDEQERIAEQVAVAAVKYSFLKVSTQQEIAFDLDESVSFDGNSGPYLQYTYARTQSVLRKTENEERRTKNTWKFDQSTDGGNLKVEIAERELLRLLSRFEEIVEEAAVRYSPNILTTYLFELAQAFNLFYQKHPILREKENVRDFRLFITAATGTVLQKGLNLLGIQAPDVM